MIRFHFIRHGETYANRDEIVLGQTESNLTQKGKEKAAVTGKVLKEQHASQGIRFWRVYTSDLQRCRDTAERIVSNYQAQNYMCEDDERIWADKRLRERAKGVREGRPKRLSHSKALELHRRDEAAAGRTLSIPLLESEEDVYYRLVEFISSVMVEALQHQKGHPTLLHPTSFPPTLSCDLHVLVVSHSGTIRTLISRILDGDHWAGSQSCMNLDTDFIIPNLSITMIDTVPATAVGSHPLSIKSISSSDLNFIWNAVAVQLPSIQHLESRASV
jgi:broad specificity phosphatase PhoE